MVAVPSVLAIDDQEEILQSLTMIFEAAGATRVRTAGSSSEAEEILKKEKFDVIIADYHMPGCSGIEFLEKLRSGGDKTPVLMLSGALDSDAIVRVVDFPKVEFLNKPFQIATLYEAIEKLLGLE